MLNNWEARENCKKISIFFSLTNDNVIKIEQIHVGKV